MRVRDFMKKEVITVEPKTPIMDALDVMKKNNIRHMENFQVSSQGECCAMRLHPMQPVFRFTS
jgi:predicted transcriptional regulator